MTSIKETQPANSHEVAAEQHSQLAPRFVPDVAFAGNAKTGAAYWFVDNLWVVLVDGRQTAGVYSLMEQLMPKDSGPRVAHIHPIDEWFYVMEGEMTVELGDQTIIGRAGDSLWIPRGTVHRFKVTSPVCRALNGYTPAGFEQVIIGLAKPAERRELPPLMDPPDQITIDKVFNNYWCAEARDGWALSRMGIR